MGKLGDVVGIHKADVLAHILSVGIVNPGAVDHHQKRKIDQCSSAQIVKGEPDFFCPTRRGWRGIEPAGSEKRQASCRRPAARPRAARHTHDPQRPSKIHVLQNTSTRHTRSLGVR